MDSVFVTSPSSSPNRSLFTADQYFDNTSESSSPSFTHHMYQTMFNSTPMQFEMFQYDCSSPPSYPAEPARIPVDYTGSSIVNEKDQKDWKSGSTSTSRDKKTTPNTHPQRRAQNRASQRAFRERKERHLKGLEHQIEDLHEKHQSLLQLYTRQTDDVSKLTSDLEKLRACAAESFSDVLMAYKFEKFDAFSEHETFYRGPEYYFDKIAVDLNSEFAVHSYEDSL